MERVGGESATRRAEGSFAISRRRKWPAQVALATVALALSVGALECVVRMAIPVHDIGPPFSEYDPVYGKRTKRSISVQRTTPEFTMTFTTSSQGFRGPELPADPRGAVVMIGDSYTEGYGVTDGQEYPALVRAALQRDPRWKDAPVINYGLGNTGNGRWVKLLRRDIARLEPRLIVLQLASNDFVDNPREGMFVLDAHGRLEEQPIRPPGMRAWLHGALDVMPGIAYSHLVSLARQASAVRIGDDEPTRYHEAFAREADAGERLTLALIDETLRIAAARRWPTIGLLANFSSERSEAVRAVFERHGVQLLRAPSKTEHPDLYYKIDAHWNARGHAEVAKTLLAAMPR